MDAMTSAPTPSTSSTQQQQGQQQQQSQPAGASNGPQVRSRVTVVCAECKRLKLKCDRRIPCGSCQKRDTVPRCIYSPAAAEKVDLHSLNNRLTVVESQLAQMGSGSRPYNHHGTPHIPPSDRALLAVGQSGSSLTISLEDVTAIWLSQLDLNKDLLLTQSQSNHPLTSSFPSYSSSTQIKLEHPTILCSSGNSNELPAALLVPPPSIYFSANPTSQEAPSVTSKLISLLPSSPSKRRKLCNNVEEIFKINPCFNWKHFRERLEGIFKWAVEAEAIERATLESNHGAAGPATKADIARTIFFGESASTPKKMTLPRPTVSFYAAVAGAFALGAQANRDQNGNVINDEDDDMVVDSHSCDSRQPSRKPSSVTSSGSGRKTRTSLNPTPPANTDGKTSSTSGCPAALFALAEQALDMFEKSNPYDLDYLIALILRALYMFHDGKSVVDHRLYPLVGKMVNIARMMGLGIDPNEFPVKYSLFEAETRRRIWWEVFCYDLYVSDSMGHAPFILDSSFTTKMPADVDENLFSPSSSSIPTPSNDDYATRYFGLKIRLAQLVKGVKKRTYKDPPIDLNSSESLSLEDAILFEAEITNFLSDLPPAFHLDVDRCLSTLNQPLDSSPTGVSAMASPSVYLIAQQCELVITSQRLILKLYLPFLRSPHPGSASRTNMQATLSTINAAHAIINASRVLHALYKQPSGIKRPGPALFDIYSFGQALFDAAVVCAHSAIQQPTAIWVKAALENVAAALVVMKDPMVATGRGPMNGGVEGSVSEAVQVIEILKKKADSVRGGGYAHESNAGSKRKHDEIGSETDLLSPRFQLPYVGAAVASLSPVGTDSPSLRPSSPPEESGDGTPPQSARPRFGTPNSANNGSEHRGAKCVPAPEGEKSKSKEKSKKPSVGIRVRAGKEVPPAIRHREKAPSTASTPESDTRMQPPPLATNQPPSVPPTPKPTNQYPFAMPSDPEAANVYHIPPATNQIHPPIQPEPMLSPTTDYPPHFNDADMNVNSTRAHKFNIHDSSSHQNYTTTSSPHLMFDQNQGNTYTSTASPVSYRPNSSNQPSGGGPLFDGAADLSSPQYGASSHHPSPQSYRPPPPPAPPNYYAHAPYQPDYDSGSQNTLSMNLVMDTSSCLNSSVTAPSGDMMYDVKPLNTDGPLQQHFRHDSGQGQVWQQSDSSNANNVGYWQSEFKPYYSP